MAPSTPLVSIIINNYNYERYLADAIKSGLAQSYDRVEVVVVDDGSRDGSRSVVESFGDSVLAVLKENGGQASAMNAGFEASRGEVVIFLDSDDVLLPHALQTLVDSLRTEDLDKIAKVQWRVRLVDAETRPLGPILPDPKRAFPPRETISTPDYGLEDYSPPTSGIAFSRGALERLMPIPVEPYRICADAYLNVVAPLFGDVVSIDEVLTLYRIHGGNGITGRVIDIPEARKRISLERRREHDFRRLAPGSPGRTFNLSDRIMRIASLRSGRAGHPVADDSEVALWGDVLHHLWIDPRTARRWGSSEKVSISAWVTATAFLPREVSLALFSALMESHAHGEASKGALLRRAVKNLQTRTRGT